MCLRHINDKRILNLEQLFYLLLVCLKIKNFEKPSFEIAFEFKL